MSKRDFKPDDAQLVRKIAKQGRSIERLETLPGVPGSANVHATVGYTFNRGSAILAAPMTGEVRVFFTGTIIRWSLLVDALGNLRLNVRRCTYAAYNLFADIDGSDPPRIVSPNIKAESTALTGWNTAVVLGDIFRFEIDSTVTPSGMTRALVTLECSIP